MNKNNSYFTWLKLLGENRKNKQNKGLPKVSASLGNLEIKYFDIILSQK
jgi:hypothetical protein